MFGRAVCLGLALAFFGCSNADPGPGPDAGPSGDGEPRFTAVPIPSLPTPEPNFFGVWGTSATDVFLVGERGTIAHFDGTTWTVQPTPTTSDLRDVWGLSPDDVYAVGNGGTILHYTAGVWAAELSTTTENLHAISGRAMNPFAWAVGVNGTIARKDLDDPAAIWELVPSSTLETLHDVYIGESGGGVAVGNLGAIVRVQNGQWTRQRVDGLNVPLAGIWGTSPDRVWIVGLDGTIRRSEGSTNFVEIEGAPLVYLRKVFGLGDGEVFITGWGGTLTYATPDGATGLERYSDHRLEGIWCTFVEVPDPNDPQLTIMVPRCYIAGVTGVVLVGP